MKDGKWQADAKAKSGHAETGPAGELPGKAGAGGPDRVADIQNPAVSSDGTFSFEHQDGSKSNIYTDGSSTRATKDGALVAVNIENKVTSINYTNGDFRQFSYDDKGKIAGVTENGKQFSVKDGQLVDSDGKPTGLKNPMIAPDGKYTTEDGKGSISTLSTDRTSVDAKQDGSFVKKDAGGHVTEVDYPDGKSQKFGYDAAGRLSSVTDRDGKAYEYKATAQVLGIRIGAFEATDGTKLNNIDLKPDGTISYKDNAGRLHSDFTTGNSTETTKTADELRQTAQQLHDGNGFLSNGEQLKKTLEALSPADRIALDAQYKSLYDTSLTDTLKGQAWNPLKADNVNAGLVSLSDAQLRTSALQTYSTPEQLAAANKQIDEFQQRSKDQNLPPEQVAAAQEKALREIEKGDKSPDNLLKQLEKTLTNTAPTLESLNTRYGVKADEEKLPDGTTVRHYYVEGEKGAKLPVLDSNSDNPVEVERQLKEFQDAKSKELEQKYNVQFSHDGQTDSPLGKQVDLRSPRIDELMALQEGFAHSEPSTSTLNGRPILVQFAAQPSSPYDAYVLGKEDGQQRILFEPLNRDYTGLKGTILHEWAHNGQNNLYSRDPEGIKQVYEQMGYRNVQVKDKDGKNQDQWQLKDKDGNYYAQGPGQFPFGNWTRVDEQGHPLKADGSLANGFEDKTASTRTNHDMADAAAVHPSSDYFPNPGENNAEANRHFRADTTGRTDVYVADPQLYSATKKLDQLDLDNDPRYGRNSDGTSKFLRLPDGNIALNNEENRKAVDDYEATLPAQREQSQNSPIIRPTDTGGLGRGNANGTDNGTSDNPGQPLPGQPPHHH